MSKTALVGLSLLTCAPLLESMRELSASAKLDLEFNASALQAFPANVFRKDKDYSEWVLNSKDVSVQRSWKKDGADIPTTVTLNAGCCRFKVVERSGQKVKIIDSRNQDSKQDEMDTYPQLWVDADAVEPILVDCPPSLFGDWSAWGGCVSSDSFNPNFVDLKCTGAQRRQRGRRVEGSQAQVACPEEQFEYRLCKLGIEVEENPAVPSGEGTELAIKIWPDLAALAVGAYSNARSWKSLLPLYEQPPDRTYVVLKQEEQPIWSHRKYEEEAKHGLYKASELPMEHKACAAAPRWEFVAELCFDIDQYTTRIRDMKDERKYPGAGLGDCASVHKHRSSKAVAIAFRGTDTGSYFTSSGDWKYNNDEKVAKFREYRVHKGFNAYAHEFSLKNAKAAPGSPNPDLDWKGWLEMAANADQVWLTGHSLGAATATLHMIELSNRKICNDGDGKCGLLTFASPKLFHKEWVRTLDLNSAWARRGGMAAGVANGKCFSKDFARCGRVWSDDDIVTSRPAAFVHGKTQPLSFKDAWMPGGGRSATTLTRDVSNGDNFGQTEFCTCQSACTSTMSGLAGGTEAHSIFTYAESMLMWAERRKFIDSRSCENEIWYQEKKKERSMFDNFFGGSGDNDNGKEKKPEKEESSFSFW